MATDVEITLKQRQRFVSRGGDKLMGAFEAFSLDVKDQLCLDVGASTGGFTDCMLQHGARGVYAVDVGKGQLHWKLRNDDRVRVMEKLNARYLTPDLFDEAPSFCTIDVSFISLKLILPAVCSVLTVPGEIVSLIKPQFEAGRRDVGAGGVVRDPAIHTRVVDRIKAFGQDELGLTCVGTATSPLKGPKGNIEFLAYWKRVMS